jgi:membrane-bound ClpP family serine protease
MEGVLLLALAVLLFSIEMIWNTRFAAGVAGTVALFAGLKELLPPAHRIHFVFALSLALVLGLITTLLCYSARKARRNKWGDLGY